MNVQEQTREIEAMIPELENDPAAGAHQLEQFLAAAFDKKQSELFYGHADFIDGLYDEFAPHIEPDLRLRGKLLGGIALAFMSIKYGESEHSPKLYGGNYETGVLATYHHAMHPRRMMRGMFEYATKVNEVRPGTFTDEDFIVFPETAGFHDVVMGDGRRIDEVLSWLLYKTFLENLGFAPSPKARAGMFTTIWDDKNQRQLIDTSEEAIDADPEIWNKRAAGVGDLLSVHQRRGPYEALCVWIEDACKKHCGQVFIKEAAAAGFSLIGVTVEDCFRFVDTRELLKQKLGKALLGNIAFMRNFQPADPSLDQYFPDRPANVAFFEAVSERFDASKLSARGVFRAARLFRDGRLFAPPLAA